MREIITIRVFFAEESYNNDEHDVDEYKKVFFDLKEFMNRNDDFQKSAANAIRTNRANRANSCYSSALPLIKEDLDKINVVIPFKGLHDYDPQDVKLSALAKTNGLKNNKEKSLKRLMLMELMRLDDKMMPESACSKTVSQFVEFGAVLNEPTAMDFDDDASPFEYFDDTSMASIEHFADQPPCASCSKYKEQIQSLEDGGGQKL